MKKTISGIVLTLLILSMLTFSFNTKPLKTEPATIVVPDDYQTIQEAINHAVDGETILVSTGIYYEHVIVNKTLSLIGEDRISTIIDGNGTDTVFNVTANGVTITGFTIRGSGSNRTGKLDSGIWVQSYNNYIANNTISNNCAGIYLNFTHNNILIGNIYVNNRYGIVLSSSNNNTLIDNKVYSNRDWGIGLGGSNNTLASNSIFSNFIGIYLGGTKNVIAYNNVSNNEYGVRVEVSDSNLLSNNNVYLNNGYGIMLIESNGNILRCNNITSNVFGVTGYKAFDYFQDVDTSNLIDGKPIYYLVNKSNLTISPHRFKNIGYFAVVNSTDITIEDFDALDEILPNLLVVKVSNSIIRNLHVTAGIEILFSNNNTLMNINVHGLSFEYSNYNKLHGSCFHSNSFGIYFHHAFSNIITNNTIANNFDGIRFGGQSENNIILHNNVIDNYHSVSYEYWFTSWVNFWDDGYPSGGNYWSDYNGTDLYSGPYQNESGSDGIGDTPYIIDENNVDGYPLMEPYPIQGAISLFPPTLSVLAMITTPVKCFIELPQGYSVYDINVTSVLVNNTISINPDAPVEVGDYNNNGILDLMVQFDKTEVISYIGRNIRSTDLSLTVRVTLTVNGLLDCGCPFQGSDAITVTFFGYGKLGIFPI